MVDHNRPISGKATLPQICCIFCAQSRAVRAFCPVCRGAVDIVVDLISLQTLSLSQIKHVAACIGNGSLSVSLLQDPSKGIFDDSHDEFAHLVLLALSTSTALICALQAVGSSTHEPTFQAGSARAAGVL